MTIDTVEKTIFDRLESEVQSYARSFPVVFEKAQGAYLFDQEGNKYIDFLAGAGSLNYGHNNPVLKQALMDYIDADGITHSLDLHTAAKAKFLESFERNILLPRNMDYVLQFTGPTGTNAVEAALKLARNITGRHSIIAFTNGFHGVSLGAAAATGNAHHRNATGVALSGVTRMPFAGYFNDDMDTLDYLDRMIGDQSSGIDLPAAVIVETVQGEGGINVASAEWLRGLEAICRKYEILLIIDDIQAGCGRTGRFFSFEESGIVPDIVTLSKSLSAYGVPFALTIFKPEYDKWKPGEHNGTFRGNNHAFVTAAKALDHYWSDGRFVSEIQRKSLLMEAALTAIAHRHGFLAKGRGMMRGLECENGDIAGAITKAAFQQGLIIETSGADDQVVKFLPPLITSEEDLKKGMDIVAECAVSVLTGKTKKHVAA